MTEKKPQKPQQSFLKKLERETLRIKLAQKIFFTENLRVMIRAGLSLTESLQTLAMQTESKGFKEVILEIREDVEEGTSLSDALGKYPKLFPPIFVNMIAAGEVSGTLENTLEQLTNQMQKDYELIAKIKSALTYPLVIVIATILIGIGMMIFVVPQILSIFDEIGAEELPLATKMLIGFSDFVSNNLILVIILLVTAVVAFSWFINTKFGKYVWHKLLLNTPIIGPIIKKINLARFSRTLSSLIRTDIPIVKSMLITSDIVNNVYYRDALRSGAESLKKGENLSTILGGTPQLFPPLIVQMTAVGERAGTIDEMLGEIADFYEGQVRQIMGNLSSIIEPILIIFLGAAVAGIALAIITPIYSLTTKFGQ